VSELENRFAATRDRPYAKALDAPAPAPPWSFDPQAAQSLFNAGATAARTVLAAPRITPEVAKDVPVQAVAGAAEGLEIAGRKVGGVLNDIAAAAPVGPLGTPAGLPQPPGPLPDMAGGRTVEGIAPEPATAVGGLTRGLASFLMLYGPASAMLGGTTFAGSLAAGAMADIMAFENKKGTISDILREYVADNAATQFLSGELSEDEWEASLKAGLEGAALGVAYPAIKGLMRAVKANPEMGKVLIDRLMQPGPAAGSPGAQRGSVGVQADEAALAPAAPTKEQIFQQRRDLMRGLEAGEADGSRFFRAAPTDELGQRMQSVLDEGLAAGEHFMSPTAMVKALTESAKQAPILMDGKPMSKAALDKWVKQAVKDGDIILPAGPGPDEVIASMKERHTAVQPQRSALMTTLYGDKPPLGGNPRPIGATDTNVLANAVSRVADYALSAAPAEMATARATAKQVLTQNYDVNQILQKNVKLKKTEKKGAKDGEPIILADGRGVETTGMSLSPAYKEGDFDLCPNHFICKDSCLGFTSGGNWAYGGGSDLDALKGPRLAHFNLTQAFMRDPEAFITTLDEQISVAAETAAKRGNKLGVRLNTLSDIHPKVFEKLIKKYPDVMFYDYTKLGSQPIAPNHHLTYSSTGLSSPEVGVVNKFQNWTRMRAVMDKGKNVAMAFTVGEKESLPAFILDKETGKRYRVIDGDLHDYRPLDEVPEGEDGVIVGLRNKDQGKKGMTREGAVQESKGFFVYFDPAKGDTVEVAAQGRPNAEVRRGDKAQMTLPAFAFFAQFPHAEDYTDLYGEDD
jgi:hypothetical protein